MTVASIFCSRRSFHGWLVGFFSAIIATCTAGHADDRTNYLLATGSTSGAYHKAGVALSTLIKLQLLPDTGIDLDPISASGPSANVRALQANEVQFALVEGLVGYFAQQGTGSFADEGRQNHLRAVAALWPQAEHFVVPSSSVITGTIDDFLGLEGQKVSLGQHDTATIASNWVLMANLGVDIDAHYDLRFLGHRASSQALVAGDIIGMGIPGKLPWSHVAQVMATLGGDAAILEFTEEQAQRADKGFGVWRRLVIPAETYPDQAEALWTIAQSNFLAVRDDVPEDTVYRITKAILENLHILGDMDETMKTITIEQALDGLPVPLHPGAKRYFQETGRLAPPRATSSKEDALRRRAPL